LTLTRLPVRGGPVAVVVLGGGAHDMAFGF
jgi:hypothetical protein